MAWEELAKPRDAWLERNSQAQRCMAGEEIAKPRDARPGRK
jgi:hypothetical protein